MNRVNHLKNIIFDFTDKHRILSAAIILAVLLVLFIFRPAPPKPIPTQKVTKGDLVQSISITGTIAAQRDVDLSFQTGGKLVWLGIKKGDYVEAYQTVALLDQRQVAKTLEKTLLDYSLARSTFDETAEDNQNRTPQEALNNEMKRILERNQWNLEKAVNSVELQDLVIQQSVLTTPIAGIVTRADVKTSGVNVTGTTTFTVTDPGSLIFNMEVDEADIARIKEEQKIKVFFNSFPDEEIVLSVAGIDFVTHTTSTGGNAYDVEAKMPENTNYQYRVGMGGNAEIIINEKKNVIVIPLSSVIDGKSVFIKTEFGSFEKRTVKLGLQNDTSAEIVSGLSEGDEVALEPSTVPQKQTLLIFRR